MGGPMGKKPVADSPAARRLARKKVKKQIKKERKLERQAKKIWQGQE